MDTIQDAPDDDLDILDAQELDYQPHRTDDPNVWGLLDVATGRRTDVPQTVYLVSGDSASGIAGILYADGTFVPKASTRVGGRALEIGLLHDVKPAPGEPRVTYVTAWDGAVPAEEFTNEEDERTREHSHGILLAFQHAPAPQRLERRHVLSDEERMVA